MMNKILKIVWFRWHFNKVDKIRRRLRNVKCNCTDTEQKELTKAIDGLMVARWALKRLSEE